MDITDLKKFLALDEPVEDQKAPCRPCLCVLKNGREHNIIAEKLSDATLHGRVGLVRHVCLYEPTPGARLVLLVDSQESLQRMMQTPGKERSLHFEAPCFVLTKAKMAIDAAEISLIESSEVIIFDHDPHLPGGGIDEDYVAKNVPALAKYKSPAGGFASNTAAAVMRPFIKVPIPPNLDGAGRPLPVATPVAQNIPVMKTGTGIVKKVPMASAAIQEFRQPNDDEPQSSEAKQ